jgi:DnaK suppressor protein
MNRAKAFTRRFTMTRSEALLRLTTRLIARRDALRKALAEDLSRLRATSEVVGCGDSIDAAVDSANDEVCSRLAEIESRELAQIEHALGRLAAGEYGRCQACGGRIPAARLNVLPYTTRCVECQRRDEGRSRWAAPDASAWPGFDEGPGLDDDGDLGFNPDEYSVEIERVA